VLPHSTHWRSTSLRYFLGLQSSIELHNRHHHVHKSLVFAGQSSQRRMATSDLVLGNSSGQIANQSRGCLASTA
jgi:hypothetical protein